MPIWRRLEEARIIMSDPTVTVKERSDGSLHESKQSATQSDGTWGRVSADHHDNGAVTGVHVTSHDSSGNENIVSLDTTNSNVGDWYGNDTSSSDSSDD